MHFQTCDCHFALTGCRGCVRLRALYDLNINQPLSPTGQSLGHKLRLKVDCTTACPLPPLVSVWQRTYLEMILWKL